MAGSRQMLWSHSVISETYTSTHCSHKSGNACFMPWLEVHCLHFKSLFIFKIYNTELFISVHENDFQLMSCGCQVSGERKTMVSRSFISEKLGGRLTITEITHINGGQRENLSPIQFCQQSTTKFNNLNDKNLSLIYQTLSYYPPSEVTHYVRHRGFRSKPWWWEGSPDLAQSQAHSRCSINGNYYNGWQETNVYGDKSSHTTEMDTARLWTPAQHMLPLWLEEMNDILLASGSLPIK